MYTQESQRLQSLLSTRAGSCRTRDQGCSPKAEGLGALREVLCVSWKGYRSGVGCPQVIAAQQLHLLKLFKNRLTSSSFPFPWNWLLLDAATHMEVGLLPGFAGPHANYLWDHPQMCLLTYEDAHSPAQSTSRINSHSSRGLSCL